MSDGTQPEIYLSVIIPAFNAEATLGDQLEALVLQQPPFSWEVIVADNGSTDRTLTVAARYAGDHSHVRALDASSRRGPAFARNAAAKAASGEVLAFCDADDIVGEGWVAAMGSALRQHPFVTGPIERTLLNQDWLCAAYGSSGGSEPDTFAGTFPFSTSANVGLQRQCFEDLAGFDESLQVGEDIELSMRLWQRGIDLHFEPEALVHYRLRHNLKDLWRQSYKYGKAAVTVYGRLRGVTTPGHHWSRGAKNWVWLVRHLPLLRTNSGRARWIVVAGGAAGRLVGSISSRTCYL